MTKYTNLNITAEIKDSADLVLETIKNPKDIPTSDAIISLIKIVKKENKNIESYHIVSLLESAGVDSAEQIKNFIDTQIKAISNDN